VRTFRIIERNLGSKQGFRVEERRWFRWQTHVFDYGEGWNTTIWFDSYEEAKAGILAIAPPCDFVVGTITIL
jgi:hypothetical protein